MNLKGISDARLRELLTAAELDLAKKREALRLAMLAVEWAQGEERSLVREGLRRDIRDGG